MMTPFTRFEFPRDDLDTWIVHRDVLKHVFWEAADSPTVHNAPMLRDEIANWLAENEITYYIFRDRIRTPYVHYTGYFIGIVGEENAVAFQLRWM
jgi:hypothetical protein